MELGTGDPFGHPRKKADCSLSHCPFEIWWLAIETLQVLRGYQSRENRDARGYNDLVSEHSPKKLEEGIVSNMNGAQC